MMIYIDSYFFFNAVMDAVALILAGLCASEPLRFSRLTIAALFGGAVSVAVLVLKFSPLFAFLSALGSFVPMVLLAFGRIRFRRTVSVSLMAFASSLFLGGAAEAVTYLVSALGGRARIGVSVFLILLFLGFGLFTLWGKRLQKRLDTTVISLSIAFEGREAAFFALVDSGCLLRDPKKGRDVILMKGAYAADLLPSSLFQKLRLGEAPEEAGIESIPIRTASGRGELPAFLSGEVKIHLGRTKKKNKCLREVLVALDFTDGGFAGCPCLVPLSVL